MSQEFKVGMLLENSLRQFTKIVSVRNGIYGITGWMSRESAEKSNVAHKFVNKYGLRYANARVIKGGKASVSKPTKTETGDTTVTDKPTKSSINKLNTADAKALAEKEGLSIEGNAKALAEKEGLSIEGNAKALAEKEGLSIEGNAKDIKGRLINHFGL